MSNLVNTNIIRKYLHPLSFSAHIKLIRDQFHVDKNKELITAMVESDETVTVQDSGSRGDPKGTSPEYGYKESQAG